MSQSLRMLAKGIEGQPLIGEGISKWKLSTGHAFREHICSKIICIMVENGHSDCGDSRSRYLIFSSWVDINMEF